jgi:uncharacterized OsmC-like protein
MPRITATLSEGTVVTMSNGRHRWRADEPIDKGGTDTGPTPYELLLGSLAACTAITLSLYGKHKGIDLETVEAEYAYDRVHADDCRDCEEETTGFIDRVSSTVRIRGTLDDAQRARLAQIVSRCPVHKTLEKSVHVVDTVEFV